MSGSYAGLLTDLKQRIRAAQVRTAMAGNASMLRLYWEIGGVLAERQKKEGWGAAVLPKLATDLHNDMPEVKGFSVRNLKRMAQFFHEYPSVFSIGPRPVAQLPGKGGDAKIGQQAVAQLPWAHNVILIQKVKHLPARLWYARQAFEHGWSRDVLSLQIQSRAHERHGNAITNFTQTLPSPQSDVAAQMLKDAYVFDFLTLEKPFHERELEIGLLRHLQDFLVELGAGFAFVGRQVHMDVGNDDFYLDLLFYHLKLRCFVVIEIANSPWYGETARRCMTVHFQKILASKRAMRRHLAARPIAEKLSLLDALRERELAIRRSAVGSGSSLREEPPPYPATVTGRGKPSRAQAFRHAFNTRDQILPLSPQQTSPTLPQSEQTRWAPHPLLLAPPETRLFHVTSRVMRTPSRISFWAAAGDGASA